jgi:hypothetical protein
VKTTPNKAAAHLHDFLADADSEVEARKILAEEGVDVNAFIARLSAARNGKEASAANKGVLGGLAARTQEEIRSFLNRFASDEVDGLPSGALARSGKKSVKRASRGTKNSSSTSDAGE